MKRILICLVLVLGAGVAYADSQSSKSKKEAKAKNGDGKTAVVTGSQIPTKVDANGRPTKSTLKVDVIDEPSIRILSLGYPVSALQRIPYAYIVGNNRR
jgi:hypothetical protein